MRVVRIFLNNYTEEKEKICSEIHQNLNNFSFYLKLWVQGMIDVCVQKKNQVLRQCQDTFIKHMID